MKKEITQYLQEQLLRSDQRLQGNIVDPKGHHYPKRTIYTDLKQYIDAFIQKETKQRWVVIPGLRGVGKTTLVSQLYMYLVVYARVERNRVLYTSLDEIAALGGNVQDVLNSYEFILGKSYESQQEPLFLFFDEVQIDDQWAKTVKMLYERSHSVFIICTGSSAVELQSTADAERRALFLKMLPMSFVEYQMVKNGSGSITDLQNNLINAVYYADSITDAYSQLKEFDQEVAHYWSSADSFDIQEYLSLGTLPFALDQPNTYQVYQSILRLLDQVITTDIQSLDHFEYDTILKIKGLLFLLAGAQDVLSFSTISNTIQLQRPTLNAVFEALEKTELLIRAHPYGAQKKRVTNPSKFLFASPAIRQALTVISGKKETNETHTGNVLEDIFGMHVYREFVTQHKGTLTYDPAEGGADFILELPNRRQIVVEIGMHKKQSKQVQKTMKKIKSDYGIIIGEHDLNVDRENNILFLPLKTFLLM